MSNAALLILTLGVCESEGTSARRNSNPFFIVPRRFCSALKGKDISRSKGKLKHLESLLSSGTIALEEPIVKVGWGKEPGGGGGTRGREEGVVLLTTGCWEMRLKPVSCFSWSLSAFCLRLTFFIGRWLARPPLEGWRSSTSCLEPAREGLSPSLPSLSACWPSEWRLLVKSSPCCWLTKVEAWLLVITTCWWVAGRGTMWVGLTTLKESTTCRLVFAPRCTWLDWITLLLLSTSPPPPPWITLPLKATCWKKRSREK